MDRPNNINENRKDRKLKDLAGTSMPYDVPDGYFEDLPAKVLDRIHKESEKKVGLRRIYVRFAAAAAIFVFATLIITMLFNNQNATIETNDEFSMIDIYQNSISSLADLEDAYLLSLIEEDSLDSFIMNEDDLDDISDEIIIEYLLAENDIEYHIINTY